MKNYNKQDEMYCFSLPIIQLIQLVDFNLISILFFLLTKTNNLILI